MLHNEIKKKLRRQHLRLGALGDAIEPLHRRRKVLFFLLSRRGTQPATERLFWHCGDHTAKPDSALQRRFRSFLWISVDFWISSFSVARGQRPRQR